MKRAIVSSVVVVLALAPSASARYLHMADAQRAVNVWLSGQAQAFGGTPGTIGRCHRMSTHAIVCSYFVGSPAIDGFGDSAIWWEGWTQATLRKHCGIHVRDPAFG